ncbi:glycosyltransferase [Winogradskyella sp.]|nr:glycosyltransferase [Winogradskyella sp.]MDC1505098.1 glycosyltransferase [Winogradskyella sp.]
MSLKVSVITATYNSAKTLGFCLDSVISQNYSNIEYIIIDGDSKDNTPGLLKAAAQNHPQIKWISEPDMGIYDALNKGVACATGDVIGFLHSDDILADTTVITAIVDVFKNNSTDGVYADLQYVDQQDVNKVIRYWKSSKFHSSLLKKGWMPAHPTLFLKREIYNKHGLFNLEFKISSDYDFMLRVLTDFSLSFMYLPTVVTKMRIGGASNGSLKKILLKSKEDYKILKQHDFSSPLYTVIFKNLSKLKQFKRLPKISKM